MKQEYPMTPKRQLMKTLSSLSTKMKQLERSKSGDLSGSQLLLIPLIDSFENPPTLGELAEVNGSSYQNTRQLLIKLESSGYVNVKQDNDDSRAIRITLTKKGEKLNEEYYKNMKERLSKLFENIEDDDVEPALRVISTIYADVDTIF